MIQLSYQAAFDPFHAAFRLLRIRSMCPKLIYIEHLRILDFYLLFPNRLQDMRVVQAHRKIKTIAANYSFKKPYGIIPDDKILFDKMEAFQLAAIETLVNVEYFKDVNKQFTQLEVTEKSPPPMLAAGLEFANTAEEELSEVVAMLSLYPLLGPNGLKARTQLLEYRYDNV